MRDEARGQSHVLLVTEGGVVPTPEPGRIQPITESARDPAGTQGRGAGVADPLLPVKTAPAFLYVPSRTTETFYKCPATARCVRKGPNDRKNNCRSVSGNMPTRVVHSD